MWWNWNFKYALMKWSNLDKEWEWGIEFQAKGTEWAEVEKAEGPWNFFLETLKKLQKRMKGRLEFPLYKFLSFLSNPNFIHLSFLILLSLFLSLSLSFPCPFSPHGTCLKLQLSVFHSSFSRHCLLILVGCRIKEVAASPKLCPFHGLSYYWVSRVVLELGSITEQTHS